MRNVAKLVLVALVAVMWVNAVAATSASAEASAEVPLFGTQSGKALSFTGTSGVVTLRAKQLGVEGTITCEKESVKGRVLNESTLARELNIELKGKCEQTISGTKTACTEPIKAALSYGELGSLNEIVLLLVAPEKETEFVKATCGSSSTKVSGDVVGEFTLNGRNGEGQYAVEENDLLLVFKDKGVTQEPEEIELLGSLMKGVALKVEGAFGEKASEEAVELLESTGQAVITDTKPYIYKPRGSLDFKGPNEQKSVEIKNDKFLNVIISKAEVNPFTYFKENENKCNGTELKKYWPVFSDEVSCSVKIITESPAKKGEKANLEIISAQGDGTYPIESK